MGKTLLITSDFWPSFGGVANYYYNLSKNFPEGKIVVLTSARKESSLHPKIINTKLLYDFFWPKWFRAFFEARNILKKEKIEIIWAGELLPNGIVAYLIKKFFKIPYFVSLHGLDIILASKNSRKKNIAKKILQNAEFITVNSLSTKELLLSLIKDESKVKIIYPGVNNEIVNINEEKKQEIIKKYNLENKKIILTVARLVNRKNHELVLQSLNILKQEINFDFVYIIIGSGENLENLQNITKKLNLEKNVLFLQDIENNDLPYFYDLCDVFVMVSKISKSDIEGFGIVYLEAGLFKKPVIASRFGGSKEAVLDNTTGFLIDDDPVELKEKIKELILNKELSNKFGENACKRILEDFLWSKISSKLTNNL